MKLFMPKDRSSLSIGFNSNYSMKIRQYLLFKIKNLPLRNCIEREKPFILFWKRLRLDWGQRFEVCFLGHGDSEFFVCPTLVTRRKDIFLYFFTELKPYHLSYSISKLFKFLLNMNIRRIHAQDPLGSFRVDVFHSKKDYQGNFD